MSPGKFRLTASRTYTIASVVVRREISLDESADVPRFEVEAPPVPVTLSPGDRVHLGGHATRHLHVDQLVFFGQLSDLTLLSFRIEDVDVFVAPFPAHLFAAHMIQGVVHFPTVSKGSFVEVVVENRSKALRQFVTKLIVAVDTSSSPAEGEALI